MCICPDPASSLKQALTRLFFYVSHNLAVSRLRDDCDTTSALFSAYPYIWVGRMRSFLSGLTEIPDCPVPIQAISGFYHPRNSSSWYESGCDPQVLFEIPDFFLDLLVLNRLRERHIMFIPDLSISIHPDADFMHTIRKTGQ